jgi:hypothetical protein
VVPESPKAQDAPIEDPEKQLGKDDEDDEEEEYSPLSDFESEKVYYNADVRESYRVEALVPIGRLQDPSIGSRESHAHGRLSTGPLQRSSPDPG